MKFVFLGLFGFKLLSLFNDFLLYAQGNNFNTGFCNSLEPLIMSTLSKTSYTSSLPHLKRRCLQNLKLKIC